MRRLKVLNKINKLNHYLSIFKGESKLSVLNCKFIDKTEMINLKNMSDNIKSKHFRKDVRLPTNMQRAMATEAEATREARAKVISAEGEQKASIALKEAADVINQSPVALQLRYLQTLTTISAEKNSTIIFPIPIEMMSQFANKK